MFVRVAKAKDVAKRQEIGRFLLVEVKEDITIVVFGCAPTLLAQPTLNAS